MSRPIALLTSFAVFLGVGLIWLAFTLPPTVAPYAGGIMVLIGCTRLVGARRTSKSIHAAATNRMGRVGAWLWCGVGEHGIVVFERYLGICLIAVGGFMALYGYHRW